MIEDKVRWDEKHKTNVLPTKPIKAVVNSLSRLKSHARAIDIACGQGRHAQFLAQNGVHVDAVDISSEALYRMPKHENITPILADLDTFTLKANHYDLVVCVNFLSRNLFVSMQKALKEEGILVMQTFVQYKHATAPAPTNPKHLLKPNELLHAFLELEILFYKEEVVKNMQNQTVKVATLIGQRP